MAEKNHTEVLVDWLKNAYSIENTLVNVLENQAERADGFPDLQSRLRGHREASMRHADMVKNNIERLGGDVSQIRAGMSKFMGDLQSKFTGAFSDSIVRDAVTGAMAEQLEISTYNGIITLANRIGEERTVETCEEILEEEKEMHDYLNNSIEELVNKAYESNMLVE